MESSSLVTVSSMYQLSCSTVMSLVRAEKLAMSFSVVSTRPICGSRMPSGRSARIWVIALRRSSTARSMSAPILSWRTVWVEPSCTVERSSSTPWTLRAAASTRLVTCVSSSLGAAPGWLIATYATGKSMSGFWLTSSRPKLISPAIVSAMKRTIGGTGLRIAQAEMLRKLIDQLALGAAEAGVWSMGLTFCPGDRNAPAAATMRSVPSSPSRIDTPRSVTAPVLTGRLAARLSLSTT